MRKIKTTLMFIAVATMFASCGLFRSGGGGGHCPAYGSSIDNIKMHQDINNAEELRLRESKRI